MCVCVCVHLNCECCGCILNDNFFFFQIVGNYDCTLGGGHNMSSKLAQVKCVCVCVCVCVEADGIA